MCLLAKVYVYMYMSVQYTCVIVWKCHRMSCGLFVSTYCYPSSKEPLVCQFRCSISDWECNKWFVTQPICNADVCATSGGCYFWIVTLWWFAHVQSNIINVDLRVTLDLSTRAYGWVDKNRTRGQILVYIIVIQYNIPATCTSSTFLSFWKKRILGL